MHALKRRQFLDRDGQKLGNGRLENAHVTLVRYEGKCLPSGQTAQALERNNKC